jgi:hypothetical protein
MQQNNLENLDSLSIQEQRELLLEANPDLVY